jgi:hypothetical protein
MNRVLTCTAGSATGGFSSETLLVPQFADSVTGRLSCVDPTDVLSDETTKAILADHRAGAVHRG